MTATLEPYEDEAPALVDLPEQRAPALGDQAPCVHEARPILPPWLRHRDDFRALLTWLGRYGAHAGAFHLTRLPLYGARLVWRAPAGLYRALGALAWWALDGEHRPIRRDAATRGAVNDYLALSALGRRRVLERLRALAVFVVLGLVAGAWLVLAAPAPIAWTAGALVVLGLGVVGTPADRRITDAATVTPFVSPPLRSDAVVEALQSLGIAAMTSKAGRIEFPAPIRDIGAGWLASVDLPRGVTPAMVMDKRQQLASGLRRPVGCVWPDVDLEAHGGRLELTVLKVEMSRARQRAYPLRKSGTADLFEPLPFGTDQRGRPVEMTLIESNLLIGSLPGAGKTASLRTVLCGVALDARVELRVWELKGSGDLESFERIAHTYGSGVDDATIEACLHDLRGLFAELEVRAAKLKQLRQTARDLVPDSKVTGALASKRSLGLHPIVFVVDEAQELFSHPDVGKEAGDIATALIKRGRALGVVLILATQRPDKDSLPTGVSANVGTRFCLRVMGQVENDMVLGTSSYKNGVRATSFTRSDRGIGYLVGATDAPVVTRVYYLDAADTDAIVSRAFVARDEAGLLTGHAIGERLEMTPAASLLDDLRTVWADATVVSTWSEELLPRLVELRPALYAGWTVEQLARALSAAGLRTRQISRQVDGRQVNRRGVVLSELLETIDRRQLG